MKVYFLLNVRHEWFFLVIRKSPTNSWNINPQELCSMSALTLQNIITIRQLGWSLVLFNLCGFYRNMFAAKYYALSNSGHEIKANILWLRKLLQSFSLLWFYLRVFYPWHKLCPGNCCLWAFLSMWWYQFTNVTDIGGAMYHENLQRNRWIFWYEDLTGVSILCVISTFHLTQTPLVFPLRLATDDSAALFKKK